MAIYMFIDGIPGGSTSQGFRNWHDVHSYNWGESMAASAWSGGGGSSAGKVQMSDFSVFKSTDVGSPVLFLNCANGKHIRTVEIHLTRSGGDVEETYLKYKLEDCQISSYNVSADEGSPQTESVGVRFAKITYTLRIPNAGGGFDEQTHFWDRRSNSGG